LCIEHSFEIDDRQRSSRFSIETLQNWKKQQLEDFDALSRQEAVEAASASFRPSNIEIHGSTVSLGGEGGNAPGAGGGGGGAIGNGARGGDAGHGGDIIDYGLVDLDGKPGTAPGAGGGGGGAIGETAVGGQGGEGGERVTAWFRAEDLPDSIEIVVGRGGHGGKYGGDGEDGGETRFGNLLTAKGGAGGRAGGNQPPVRQVVKMDLEQGLRVSGLHLAQCIHTHHGLLDLLSADWEYWMVQSLPCQIQWPLLCTVSMGQLAHGTALEIAAVVFDPSGSSVFNQTFAVVQDGDDQRKVAFVHQIVDLHFTASIAGVWSIAIISGRIELARLPIEIRLPCNGNETA
jgi:hypothetical protein